LPREIGEEPRTKTKANEQQATAGATTTTTTTAAGNDDNNSGKTDTVSFDASSSRVKE